MWHLYLFQMSLKDKSNIHRSPSDSKISIFLSNKIKRTDEKKVFENFRNFLDKFRFFFGIFEKLFFVMLICYSAHYRYRSMIGKFLSNFFQFHLTRWPKMTFKWPFKDPKVWNLTLKPINYPILLIQLICQLQNIHFSNILTISLKKLKFHEF